jgi:cytoskeleton protein RodZ
MADDLTSLNELGEQFRQERLRRRFTVGQVSAITLLRPRIIEAIEAGDFRALPAPVFTVGLVRTYARHLGLDFRPFVRAYEEQAAQPVATLRTSPFLSPPRQSSRGPALLFPLIVVALLLGLTGYLYEQYATFVGSPRLAQVQPSDTLALLPTPQPSPLSALTPANPPTAIVSSPTPRLDLMPLATVMPVATSATVPTVRPTATTAPAPAVAHGVAINTRISDRVWLQVEADGQVIFSGILNPGDQRLWNASDHLMIWSGNAGAVDVTYNGKPLGKLGSPGEVVKVTWTVTAN